MTNPFQRYGRIAESTSLTVLDTYITPYSLFNISKDGEIIVTNTDEQMTTSKYSTVVLNGSIQFAILNTYVTDEATYTYRSGLGDAANYTLSVEGKSNDYIMLYFLMCKMFCHSLYVNKYLFYTSIFIVYVS